MNQQSGSDRSGTDIDVWGGEDTVQVLIPQPGEPCILLDDEGKCPTGCRQCLDFAEEMKMLNHEKHEAVGVERLEIINQKS
jgi:hypothetical protein